MTALTCEKKMLSSSADGEVGHFALNRILRHRLFIGTFYCLRPMHCIRQWLQKKNPTTLVDQPVVDAPVQAEVEGAEVAALPHHLHHCLVVELRDVPQVQDVQVAKLWGHEREM